jgi:hypothetical protein
MGVFGTGLDSSSQPIVNFDWPDREIIWTTSDCLDSSSTEDKWDLCMWSENLYKMTIELEPGQSNEITLEPGDSSNVEMTLHGIRVPGNSDIVIADSYGAPAGWFVEAGFSNSYQSTTTLIMGTTSDLDLFLRAPNLQEINEDQTFHLTVTVTSSTKIEATTSMTLLVISSMRPTGTMMTEMASLIMPTTASSATRVGTQMSTPTTTVTVAGTPPRI